MKRYYRIFLTPEVFCLEIYIDKTGRVVWKPGER